MQTTVCLTLHVTTAVATLNMLPSFPCSMQSAALMKNKMHPYVR